jgi:hypothetical protein
MVQFICTIGFYIETCVVSCWVSHKRCEGIFGNFFSLGLDFPCVQLGNVSPSLEPNFVVVQFKSYITLFKFIKKRVIINFKVLLKGMHDHLGEQVNILIDWKDKQKKYTNGPKNWR